MCQKCECKNLSLESNLDSAYCGSNGISRRIIVFAMVKCQNCGNLRTEILSLEKFSDLLVSSGKLTR